MIVLICLDGYRVGEVLTTARQTLSPSAEWVILHVSDTRPMEEVGRALGGLAGRGLGRERAEAHLRRTVEWGEAEVQAAVANWLRDAGQAADCVVIRGRPEREILRVAEERRVDLVVLGGGRGFAGHFPGPGPYPLSPVTRFVVDHARCDVLVLRRYVAEVDRRL